MMPHISDKEGLAMIFTIQHSLGQETIWKLFTTDDFMIQWLAEKSDINWKKNGNPLKNSFSIGKVLKNLI